MKPRVSIIIPTYNHCDDFLVPCLESIKKYTNLDDVEVLVVANGCIDETRSYVESLGEPFKLLWFDEGLGFTKATNIGIQSSIGEYVILLNNDTILLEQKCNDWVERLLAPFEKNEKMGIVGPHYLRDPNTESDFIVFFCVMIRKQVFRDVGLLDEIFSPGAGEDTDMVLRAKLHGYEVGYTNTSSPSETQEFCVGDFPIYHKGEGTFGSYAGWNEIFERNSKLLRDRKVSGYYDKVEQITKNKPKVSVICTCYNYSRFLGECLSSIRAQTFQDFEIIFVDDASTDNSVEVAQKYNPDLIIRHEVNLGTVTSKNDGIAKSVGEFVCCIDADDVLDIQYFEKCVAALDKDLLCGLSYSDFWHFGGGLDNGVIFQDYSYSDLRKFNYILGSAMFRRKAYDEVGGFSLEMDAGWEDYDLTLSICERGWTAVRVPGYLYRYRNHGANRTANMDYGPLLEKLAERHKEKPIEVTATICTRGRYFTTLPLAINAVIQQTYKPKGLIIFDDGEHKDLREVPVYQNLFKMLDAKGIGWEIKWTPQHGQVINHNFALNYITTDWIWRCFRGREKVETIKGLKNIRDITVGELVKTHKGGFQKVSKTYKISYPETRGLIWVRTKNSLIKCTPEHPFFVNTENGNKFVIASELTSEMSLLYPSAQKESVVFFDCFGRGPRSSKGYGILNGGNNNYSKEYFGNVGVDLDLARFFGLYLAEGCGGHDSIRFTFNNNEREYIDFISKVCREKFNRQPTIHSRWATTVKLNIRSFGKRFVEWFGKDATEKRIPDFVFDWDLQYRLAFLGGYFDGDGWEHEGGCIHFGTSSKRLFEDLGRLLQECGLDCKGYIKSPSKSIISNRLVRTKKSYVGRISKSAYEKMKDLMGAIYVGEYLKIPIVDVVAKKMPSVTGHDDQYVYNLEVQEDNTYIVGPAIVHNCDDDNIPEHDVLEKLVARITPEVGAVAGLVFDPKNMFGESKVASNQISDIYQGFNIQWFKQTEVKEVDHLYSTFLYRRAAGKHGYQTDLSPAGHREETMFSFSMKRKGYKLLVVPDAITWHIREPQGGIRTHTQSSYWEHDEQIFHNKLHEWGITPRDTKWVVLNCGLGDHLVFKSVLKEMKEKYPTSRIILAVCYPEVFENESGVELVSIAEAESVIGSDGMLKHNVYKVAWDLNHTGHLREVYRKMYITGELT